MDPCKVQGVLEWPTPCSVKEVQPFLGLINFYCHFICDFSGITGPLNVLTHKSKKWSWNDQEQRAFEALKIEGGQC